MISSFAELVDIMKKLREPEGCPWDREQTWGSLIPFIIEESYELVEALKDGKKDDIIEECGDLLLQVVFIAQIASEKGFFNMEDVIEGICGKLIRRHPHVFSDAKVDSAREVSVNWDRIKKSEKGNEFRSILAGIPKGLPALVKAYQLQDRAAKVGFDWDEVSKVWEKIREETRELENALDNGELTEIEEEFGDVLFSFVNLSRFINVHPETALERINAKFKKRFEYIEKCAHNERSELSSLPLLKMEEWWEESKKHEEEKQ